MAATFVAAEGGVVGVDVAVAGAELAGDGTLVDAAGAYIVAEHGHQKGINAVTAVVGAEFRQILAEDAVGFGMGVVALLEGFALLDDMAVGDCEPVLDGVEGLVVTDEDAGTFEGVESQEVGLMARGGRRGGVS